jgi:hypothetical protein
LGRGHAEAGLGGGYCRGGEVGCAAGGVMYVGYVRDVEARAVVHVGVLRVAEEGVGLGRIVGAVGGAGRVEGRVTECIGWAPGALGLPDLKDGRAADVVSSGER